MESFLTVNRTFLFRYFRGCWLLDIFCVCAQSMWTYNEAGISSCRRLSFLNDYNRMAFSFLTKLNFWRRKLYRIWLDSFLHLSWFTTVCLSSLFLTDLERHQLIDPVNAMSLNCLCSSIFARIFGKQQSLLSPVILPLLRMEYSSIQMILGSVFLDVAVIRHDQTILRDNNNNNNNHHHHHQFISKDKIHILSYNEVNYHYKSI